MPEHRQTQMFPCCCFRSARCVHGRVRITDRLRQRPGGPAGTGSGSLLHIQRSVGPRGSADQQLQVQRRRHPADVTVAPRSVALRKQPGNKEVQNISMLSLLENLRSILTILTICSAVVFMHLCCRKWTQSSVEAAPSPTSLTNWNHDTTLLH